MQRPPAGEREIERAPIHPGLLRPCALAAGFLNLGLKKRDDIFGRQQAPLLPSSLWNSIRHDHVSGESCLTSSVGPTPAMPFGQRPQALPRRFDDGIGRSGAYTPAWRCRARARPPRRSTRSRSTPSTSPPRGRSGLRHAGLMHWPRGVDAKLFRPRPDASLGLLRPILLSVGRLAIEKNLAALLALDLPGTKSRDRRRSGARRARPHMPEDDLPRRQARRGSGAGLRGSRRGATVSVAQWFVTLWKAPIAAATGAVRTVGALLGYPQNGLAFANAE